MTTLKPSGFTEFDCTWPEHKLTWNRVFKYWWELEDLLERVGIPREGWEVKAEPAQNMVLFRGEVIDVETDEPATISHRFTPPPFHKFDEAYWIRWVLDRLMDIERHELCEGFTVDGVALYKPHDATGRGHYTIRLAP